MKWNIEENEEKTSYYLTLRPQLEAELEARKLVEVIKFLIHKIGLEKEVNVLEFGMPPYYKFKDKNNISVTVALDDYDGLSIDSNSKEFLEKLAPLLQNTVFVNEFKS